MQISVTFKNLDPSDNLRSYVSNKLNKLDKLLDNPAEANVVLSVEKIRHITEIRLSGDRLNLVCREKTNDMYSSIDMALDKLEKQIKKNKEKQKRHKTGSRGETLGRVFGGKLMDMDAKMDEKKTPESMIIIENIEYKPMDIEEAAMQMELVSDPFLVFTNARTQRVNVLYRKSDGALGLIQPTA
ncbi:MAG: ribosome-associated translation inhibitor RaiA [Deltaproteobacteria bacterium]|nr:ribosome-associated translation inhibitor RaiA [Deltaproteobacteria bacterium]